ncbi:MAG: lysophospholipid acyltransferase family protein [Planctomycetota bacterium]|nr:lysophospholipid acyltransferase family protein [Planctomycetota bacterium]MDE2217669.1 lysophospholipid acyltransferase family protein [Planctomycetota bacterium]
MKKLKFLLVGILGAWLIKLLTLTIRIDDDPKGFNEKTKSLHVIYAFWHCMMLIPAYVGRKRKIQVLISQHSDGEYIAQVIKRLGFGVIRGSTTRGGIRAVKALVDKAREGYPLAITPDGPRGPRFIVQHGSIYLGKKTQLPIIPTVVGLSSYWELPSWDRFRIPKPFSRALMMYGNPIPIPPYLSEEEMEHYRLLLENTMKEMAKKADALVRQKL